jgi:hypothetical protein
MKLFNNIAYLLLASFYVATASTLTISVVIEGIPSSGAKAIVADTGVSIDIPAPRIERGRHMPMVKQIPVPSAIVQTFKFPRLSNDWKAIAASPTIPIHSNNEYSPSGNRAPPAS